MDNKTYPNFGAIWNRENTETGTRSFWGTMTIDGKNIQFVARLNRRKIEETDIEKKRKQPDFLMYPYVQSTRASKSESKTLATKKAAAKSPAPVKSNGDEEIPL
jgi:hypothetical protein